MSLIGAALIGAGASVLGGLLGARSQSSANSQNMEQFNRQMDYTEQTQREAWRRDDTSLQRAVADANAAGLSPLAALPGGSPNASVVSQPHAPTIQPLFDASLATDAGSNIVDSMIANAQLNIEQKKLDNISAEKDLDRKNQVDLLAMQLAQNNKQFEAKLAQEHDQFTKSHIQSIIQFNKTIAQSQQSIDFNQTLETQKYMLDDLKTILSEVRGKTGGLEGAYKVYTDRNSYQAAWDSWSRRYADWQAVELQGPAKKSVSSGAGSGVNAGGNLGVSGSGTAGLNVGANVNSYGSVSSDFESRDKFRFNKFITENPVPIFRYAKRDYY